MKKMLKCYFQLSGKLKNTAFKSFTFLPFYSKGNSSDDENKYFMVGTLFWHSVLRIISEILCFLYGGTKKDLQKKIP